MEKVLILGINGFTGKYFQQYIKKNKLKNKYFFIGIDKANNTSCQIKCFSLDLLKQNSIENIIVKEKPSYIINFAGILKPDNPFNAIEINANISLRIFECIVKNKLKVKKILLIGSAAEYGKPKYLPIDEKHELNPITFYGLSKCLQTQYADYYARNFGLKINIARTFNLLGHGLPDSLAIGSFANQIKKARNGGTIFTGDLDSKRDFIIIEDAIDAYWKILLKGKQGEIYNVCSGKSLKILSILKKLINDSGKIISIKVVKKKINKKYDISDVYGSNMKLCKLLKLDVNSNYIAHKNGQYNDC